MVEMLIGNHNRTGGVCCVASPSSAFSTYSISSNQSYVFIGDSTGVSWTTYTGYMATALY